MTVKELRSQNKNCLEYLEELIKQGYTTVKEVLEEGLEATPGPKKDITI